MEDATVRLKRIIVHVAKIDAINVTLAGEGGRSVTVPIDAISPTVQPLLLMTHVRFYAHLTGDELLVHNLAPAPTAHSHRGTVGRSRTR